jgi:uncharacterized protein
MEKEKSFEKSLLYKSGTFALVCIGLLALTYIYYAFSSRNDMNKKTLPSQGKGEVTVTANKAKITSFFEFEAKTADESSKLLAAKMNEVKIALNKEGVDDKDRKTVSTSNNPVYENVICNYIAGKPCPVAKVIGYTSGQTLEISFDIKEGDKSKAEKVLGLMPSLGAKSSFGPEFVVDNKEAMNQARELAIKDAKEKAEVVARALGMRLGDVMYYNENNAPAYPVPMYSAKSEMRNMSAMDTSMPVPVEIGSDKVSVTVDITYELE